MSSEKSIAGTISKYIPWAVMLACSLGFLYMVCLTDRYSPMREDALAYLWNTFCLVTWSLLVIIALTVLFHLLTVAKMRYHPTQWIPLEIVTVGLSVLLFTVPIFVIGAVIANMRFVPSDRQNFIYGILCLAISNLYYFYEASRQQLTEAYAAPAVTFARSLGVNKRDIFFAYVVPKARAEHLTIVKELIPHLFVESIVIEYVFAYNACMGSALLRSFQSGEYGSTLVYLLSAVPLGWAVFLLVWLLLWLITGVSGAIYARPALRK